METNLLQKVSIVLPTYNGAKYLREAIDSCLNQTHENIELVIVDDCSADETPEVIKSYKDPRINYIRNQTNQGLPRSLNIGFAHVTGEYLTWTSDDNQFMPEAVGVMLKFLTENPSVDFVYTDNLTKYWDTGETKKRNIAGSEEMEERNCIGACYLYTRRVYETVGDFNPHYELVEDYEYWVRVSKRFHMHYLPQTLYIYGEHSKSLTGTRMMSVRLFDKIMKYQYRFIPFPQFYDAVKQFLFASIDCRKNFTQLLHFWLKTARPIFCISFPSGVFFVSLAIYSLIIKTPGYAIKKLMWPLRKRTVEQKIQETIKGLRKEDGKINILCAVYSMKLGGAQKVALGIAQGLKQHEKLCFHLVTARRENQRLKGAFSESFKNIVVIDSLPDEKLYQLYLTRIIEELDIKVLLISHSSIVYQCIPELKRTFKGLKIVDILHLERVGPTRDEMLWVNPYIDKRVCISHGLRKHMIAKVGADNGNAARFVTIYNGIDLAHYKNDSSLKWRFKSQFNISEEIKLISFIARFSDEKNPLLFIDIAERIMKNKPQLPVKFVMAGDGHLFAQVKEKIHEYGLDDHIILTGMLDNVRELLADTYLLASVSNNEGIPLTVMEAMAMNVPVVSTVVGATDEVLKDGVHGYLIPQNDDMVEQFADRISGLLRDGHLYRSLSMAPKDKFREEFSRENMCMRYQQILEELAAGRADGNEQAFKDSFYR